MIDFEKDAEEIPEMSKIPPNENDADAFCFVDNEFDAEIVDVGSIGFPNSALDQIMASEEPSSPIVLTESKILSISQITKLVKYLPIVIQQHSWVLLYSVLRDGADFTTFFSRTRGLSLKYLEKAELFFL